LSSHIWLMSFIWNDIHLTNNISNNNKKTRQTTIRKNKVRHPNLPSTTEQQNRNPRKKTKPNSTPTYKQEPILYYEDEDEQNWNTFSLCFLSISSLYIEVVLCHSYPIYLNFTNLITTNKTINSFIHQLFFWHVSYFFMGIIDFKQKI